MSNCNCRRCVGPTEARTFVVAPTPVTVTVDRMDADEAMGEPDRLDISAYRGTTRLGSTEIHRGESLDSELAIDWLLSDNERDQISAAIIAEWLAWPTEQEPKGEPAPQGAQVIDLFEALRQSLQQMEQKRDSK